MYIVKFLGQTSRYLIVGILNTLVSLSIIWGSMYIGVDYVNANILGYLIGLFVSFTLNSQWTFERRVNSSVCSLFFSVLRFLIAFMIAWVVNYLFLIFSIKFFDVSEYIAQIGALATYTIVFFFLCRIFVFKNTNRN